MNNLSWMLYAADTLPRFADLLFGFAGLVMLFLVVVVITKEVGYAESRGLHTSHPDYYPEPSEPPRRFFVKVFSTCIIVLLLSALIPSKETVYLIAGSEAGEMVLETPESQEILDDIHKVIKHQLGQLAGEE